MPSNKVYLLLGANLGDRKGHLRAAAKGLEALLGPSLQASSVYESQAWGLASQPDFLNQVLVFELEEGREEWLMQEITQLEKSLGRVRGERWGPRVIDIDMLLSGSRQIHTETLILPHPRLHLRRFALVPLSEIAPGLIHPDLGKSIAELLESCPDTLPVKKLETGRSGGRIKPGEG